MLKCSMITQDSYANICFSLDIAQHPEARDHSSVRAARKMWRWVADPCVRAARNSWVHPRPERRSEPLLFRRRPRPVIMRVGRACAVYGASDRY